MKTYITSVEGFEALARAFKTAHGMFSPPPDLTLSQWADEFAYIPKEAAAHPGKFRTDFAEYQRGAQDAITDPSIESVVFMWASQTGKTQIQLNATGFYSHWDPSPILSVQTSEREAEKYSKNRIAKVIRDTPVLRKLFPSPRTRNSGNTLLNKEFPGGVLIMAGANAPAGLASMPIRVLILDEVDRWDDSAGTEGDPADIADKRTTTFWNRKKIWASTPGIKNLSRIEKVMASSDYRKYYVPCPHCGTMQTLEWPRLHWEEVKSDGDIHPRISDVYYICEEGCIIRERTKFEMIRRGEWRATQRSHDGKTAGFHLNALYSPALDWIKLVEEWREAQGSLEQLKVFINTRLAQTWEIRGTGASVGELEKHKEQFHELLPAGVLYLTAGVDTQDNRLEASVIGWGLDDERWVIDHQVFPGDPSLPDTDAASPWAALREFLNSEWPHVLRPPMRIAAALIDSGGHHTERVYEFARKHELRRWYASVGRAGIGRVLLNSGSRVGPWKTLLYTVGVDTAKEDIYTSFRVNESGPGYCHFSDTLPLDYFAQVTAEKLVKIKKDFITTMRWEKTAERNEALDCFVYARAAVAIRRPNFRKLDRELSVWVTRHRAEIAAAGKPLPTPSDEMIGAAAPKPAPVESETPEMSKKRVDNQKASAVSQLRNILRGF